MAKKRRGKHVGFYADLPVAVSREISRRAAATKSPLWQVVTDAIFPKNRSKR